ncbi:hypothetical protein [Nostoc sp.]|uniref:hypothetical protein n=1 Tax=Nostoc sp. TaxID=1180 RepID=UPI002FF1B435
MQQIKPNFQTSVSKLRDMAVALLEEVVADLDEKWGGGEISASAYDTAWVAMVRNPHNPNELAFSQSFNWLLEYQAIDGGWGNGLFSYRILPTLAALLALLKAPERTEKTCIATERAKAFLYTAFDQWSYEQNKDASPSYEILITLILMPNLLTEVKKQGVEFEFLGKSELQHDAQKFLVHASELIFNDEPFFIHFLEAFATSVDFKSLKKLQAAYGGYGCSPSATAAVLIYGSEWDDAAANWLTHLSNRAFDGVKGAMPCFYPVDCWEVACVLYNLATGGFDLKHDFPQQLLQKLLSWLQLSLTSQGVGMSLLGGIPNDAHCTSLVVLVLNKLGLKVPVDCLLYFERSDYFACFDKGNWPAFHSYILAALLSFPSIERSPLSAKIAKLVDILYFTKDDEGFWTYDSNINPFYGTALAVRSLSMHEEPIVKNNLKTTIKWVLSTQSDVDGGWGCSNYSTLEETAYALSILQSVSDLIEPFDYQVYREAIHRGVDYILQHLDEFYPDYNVFLPKFSLGKELHTYKRIVFSVLIGVLYHFTNMDWSDYSHG